MTAGPSSAAHLSADLSSVLAQFTLFEQLKPTDRVQPSSSGGFVKSYGTLGVHWLGRYWVCADKPDVINSFEDFFKKKIDELKVALPKDRLLKEPESECLFNVRNGLLTLTTSHLAALTNLDDSDPNWLWGEASKRLFCFFQDTIAPYIEQCIHPELRNCYKQFEFLKSITSGEKIQAAFGDVKYCKSSGNSKWIMGRKIQDSFRMLNYADTKEAILSFEQYLNQLFNEFQTKLGEIGPNSHGAGCRRVCESAWYASFGLQSLRATHLSPSIISVHKIDDEGSQEKIKQYLISEMDIAWARVLDKADMFFQQNLLPIIERYYDVPPVVDNDFVAIPTHEELTARLSQIEGDSAQKESELRSRLNEKEQAFEVVNKELEKKLKAVLAKAEADALVALNTKGKDGLNPQHGHGLPGSTLGEALLSGALETMKDQEEEKAAVEPETAPLSPLTYTLPPLRDSKKEPSDVIKEYYRTVDAKKRKEVLRDFEAARKDLEACENELTALHQEILTRFLGSGEGQKDGGASTLQKALLEPACEASTTSLQHQAPQQFIAPYVDLLSQKCEPLHQALVPPSNPPPPPAIAPVILTPNTASVISQVHAIEKRAKPTLKVSKEEREKQKYNEKMTNRLKELGGRQDSYRKKVVDSLFPGRTALISDHDLPLYINAYIQLSKIDLLNLQRLSPKRRNHAGVAEYIEKHLINFIAEVMVQDHVEIATLQNLATCIAQSIQRLETEGKCVHTETSLIFVRTDKMTLKNLLQVVEEYVYLTENKPELVSIKDFSAYVEANVVLLDADIHKLKGLTLLSREQSEKMTLEQRAARDDEAAKMKTKMAIADAMKLRKIEEAEKSLKTWLSRLKDAKQVETTNAPHLAKLEPKKKEISDIRGLILLVSVSKDPVADLKQHLTQLESELAQLEQNKSEINLIKQQEIRAIKPLLVAAIESQPPLNILSKSLEQKEKAAEPLINQCKTREDRLRKLIEEMQGLEKVIFKYLGIQIKSFMDDTTLEVTVDDIKVESSHVARAVSEKIHVLRESLGVPTPKIGSLDQVSRPSKDPTQENKNDGNKEKEASCKNRESVSTFLTSST